MKKTILTGFLILLLSSSAFAILGEVRTGANLNLYSLDMAAYGGSIVTTPSSNAHYIIYVNGDLDYSRTNTEDYYANFNKENANAVLTSTKSGIFDFSPNTKIFLVLLPHRDHRDCVDHTVKGFADDPTKTVNTIHTNTYIEFGAGCLGFPDQYEYVLFPLGRLGDYTEVS